jgi:prepilin-type N-terminal cleavage/methylation domain-containing protein
MKQSTDEHVTPHPNPPPQGEREAWCLVPKLRLGTHRPETPFRVAAGETEFRGAAFPNGVWERDERERDQGEREAFTLVELLVATMLLVVLASLALLIIPSLNQGQQTPKAATQLQQWIEIAKQRAVKDRAPRGVRLVYTLPPGNQMQVTQLEFIELPDPYTLHAKVDPFSRILQPSIASVTAAGNGGLKDVVTFSPSGTKTLTGGFSVQDSNLWPVQVGDYIELAGVVYRIKSVDGPLQLRLGPPPPQIALPTDLPPIGVSTSNYKIIRQPRPVPDEIMQMPANIIIDLTPRLIGGPVSNNPPRGALDLPVPIGGTSPNTWPPLDILFAPDGRVIPAVGGTNLAAYDRIILWVRDTTVPDGQNDPTLVIIYPRTGLIAAQPVDTDPGNPYSFTTTGQRAQ